MTFVKRYLNAELLLSEVWNLEVKVMPTIFDAFGDLLESI